MKKKSNLSYFEKLKDPRWQKKRLEVFELNDWTCTCCQSKESTLHVHHRAYKKNAEPWEYDAHELDCLCESCHKNESILDELINKELFDYKVNALSKEYLIGILQAANATTVPFNNVIEVFSYEQCQGIAAFCEFRSSRENEENGISAADIIYTPIEDKYDRGEISKPIAVVDLDELDWLFNEKKLTERVLNSVKKNKKIFIDIFTGKCIDCYGTKFWPEKLVNEVKHIIGVN